MAEHRFGGTWTEEKLARLEQYLKRYMEIFHANERAQFLRTVYVDAFAGTGEISTSRSGRSGGLFPELDEAEVQGFLKGSAQRALDVEPHQFDHYLFIEKDPDHVAELARLKNLYFNANVSVEIAQADANEFLPEWCSRQNWKTTRAVVFLDPYSMEVDWSTIQVLSDCKVDLWLLWPIGQAINRLLTAKKLPEESWQRRLTAAFGTDEWKDRFYGSSGQAQLGLFGDEDPNIVKVAGFKEIEEFFLERLGGIFTHVAPQPLYLTNSKNTPIYLLCFASHNETALKIAHHLLTH